MADKCNIYKGSGGRYKNNTDLFGISDTGVNRNVYPERNLPCDEHVSDIVDRHPGCGCRDRNNDRAGGIDIDRSYRGSSSDMGLGGIEDRHDHRNHNTNCLCKIIHCLCGRRRHRRDSSSS